MNKLAFLLMLTLLYATSARGGSASIGGEFSVQGGGVPSSYAWESLSCPGKPDVFVEDTPYWHGVLCTSAERIVGFVGTSTVKNPGTEALVRVKCNGRIVWQGEQKQGTVAIVSPPLPASDPFVGPCWMEVGLGSDVYRTFGYELQLTLYFESTGKN